MLAGFAEGGYEVEIAQVKKIHPGVQDADTYFKEHM